jgi:hypothetical protein
LRVSAATAQDLREVLAPGYLAPAGPCHQCRVMSSAKNLPVVIAQPSARLETITDEAHRRIWFPRPECRLQAALLMVFLCPPQHQIFWLGIYSATLSALTAREAQRVRQSLEIIHERARRKLVHAGVPTWL